MILYTWLRTNLLPLFVNVSYMSNPSDCETIFETFFMIALSAVLVHALVVLPYKFLLYCIRFKKWGKN